MMRSEARSATSLIMPSVSPVIIALASMAMGTFTSTASMPLALACSTERPTKAACGRVKMTPQSLSWS